MQKRVSAGRSRRAFLSRELLQVEIHAHTVDRPEALSSAPVTVTFGISFRACRQIHHDPAAAPDLENQSPCPNLSVGGYDL